MRIKNIKTKHITYAALGVLVGFVILLAISPVIGLRFDTILSGSMSPSMNIGDLVVVTPTSPEDLKESLDIIASRKFKVSDLITHRFGLSEIQKAFDVVCKAQDSLKVVIDPSK